MADASAAGKKEGEVKGETKEETKAASPQEPLVLEEDDEFEEFEQEGASRVWLPHALWGRGDEAVPSSMVSVAEGAALSGGVSPP